MKVHKRFLNLSMRSQFLNLPFEFQFISLKLVGGVPTLFFVGDEENEPIRMKVSVLTTGEEIPKDCIFLGTIEHEGLVRHYFINYWGTA